MKIVSLSIDLDWVDSVLKWQSKLTILGDGLIAAKNHCDNATFSSARFTKDDDVWSRLLGNFMRFFYRQFSKRLVPDWYLILLR